MLIGVVMRGVFLRVFVAWGLLSWLAADAGAQVWSYQSFVAGTTVPTTVGTIELRGTDPASLRLRMAAGNLIDCYRADLAAAAEVQGDTLVILAAPRMRGCDELKFVIRLDGGGGKRFFRQPGAEWSPDPNERGLRLVGGSLPAWLRESASVPTKQPLAVAPTVVAASPPAAPAVADSRTDEAKARQELDLLRQQLERERLQVERERAQALAERERSQAAARAPRQTARALVIGNANYEHFGRLPNPGNDARAIAGLLQGMGIEVDVVLDADRDKLTTAVLDYQRKAQGKDVNLLFYAGHGVQVDGINYLVPTNMRATGMSAQQIKFFGVALNDIVEGLPAKTRLVFLDACRDNPVSRSLLGTRSAGGMGLAPVSASSGTLIAYATKDGSTAEDGSGEHSPFTTALLQHLPAPQDIGIVLRQVRQSVLKMTGNRQEPWEYGSLLGDALVLSQMAR